MIYNATLLRIDRGTPDAAGDVAFATGATRSVRCAVDVVTSSQRFTIGATIKDASQVLLVEKAQLAAAGGAGETPPANGDHLVFSLDGELLQTGEVIDSSDRVHGFQSHHQLFLKKV